ncbi:MAG: HAMP domain-containing histidine kinase [Flavobacteriales bacterium]|nr:HAMP domain-containing histidine kinase [Flavobacteriales bacterium]MDW8411032.1 HAMP domain-containing sensor histidine kinase [Flavobacteriales bacterium]
MRLKVALLLIIISCIGLLGYQAFLLYEAHRLLNHELHAKLKESLEQTIQNYRHLLNKRNGRTTHDVIMLDSLLQSALGLQNLPSGVCYALINPALEGVYYSSDDVTEKVFNNSQLRGFLPLLPGQERPWQMVLAPCHNLSFRLARMELFVFGFLLVSSLVIVTFIVVWRLYRQQKDLSEVRSGFISNLAHEFRTPLASIRLAAETLRDLENRLNPETLFRYTRIIVDQTDHLQRHVEAVLQASEQEQRGLALHLQKLNVLELIGKARDTMALRYPQARFIVNNEAGPVALVRADEAHITHVFLNILDNAVKYNHQPVPEIRILIRRQKDYLSLVFQDNGIGIERKHWKGIFEKFYRVPQGRNTGVKGFGLGLSYVKQIVALHQGSLFIRSEPGKGTILEVRLPMPS